jgi:type I restriction enzyme S subunit
LLTGKKRLKGFEGEWEEVTLKDIAERITRKNDELDDTVVTISAQRGLVLQEDFFTKRVASETLTNYYLIHRGEFAYNKSYSNGYPMGAFKRLEDFEKAVVTTLYICFALNKDVNSDFMNHFFEAGLMIRPLMKIAQEGGRAHGLLNIGIHDFFGLKLTIPSLEEQEAITAVLSEADKELKLHQKQLTTLKEQKKGLMQKLLTGEIRVKTNE